MVSGSLDALQAALSHLVFNVFGIIIWYPIPFMRRFPIGGARWLGRATRRSRYVPIIYIGVVFYLIPLGLLGISSLFDHGSVGFTVIGIVIVLAIVYFLARFFWWLKRKDGIAKILDYLDKREVKSNCMKTLPQDMFLLKADMKQVKTLCYNLVDHTGMPVNAEEESEAEPSNDKLQEGLPTSQAAGTVTDSANYDSIVSTVSE